MAEPSVMDECRERFDEEPLIEACELGAEEAVGAGEHNIEFIASEGDLPDDPHEVASEIYGDFTYTHPQGAHFANVVEPKLDALAEQLAEEHGTETWAVESEVTEAYYYGVSEQIEDEVEEEMESEQVRF